MVAPVVQTVTFEALQIQTDSCIIKMFIYYY